MSCVKSVMPNFAKLAWVLWATTMAFGLLRKYVAKKPPTKMPATKNRFQLSFFQSYLKNGTLAGMHMAQMWLSADEIPNFLLPKSNSVGTVKPIKTPASAQCQGCFIISSM